MTVRPVHCADHAQLAYLRSPISSAPSGATQLLSGGGGVGFRTVSWALLVPMIIPAFRGRFESSATRTGGRRIVSR